ncbi:MAG: hypothetical protein ABSG03_27225 [Bryobacteraceae bacterium]|jgi:hypothetical protein
MQTADQTTTNRNSPEASGQAASASRFNPRKNGIDAPHQIMFDETAEGLAELAAEYHQHHSPANPDERFLVDALIHSEWRLRRMRRTEAELWDTATNAFLAKNMEAPACSSGDAFATASGEFERLQRIANSCERTYHRSLKELRAKVGQALSPANPDALPQPPQPEAAPTPAVPPQPKQSKTTSAKLGSFRQKPQTPAAAPPQPPLANPPSTHPNTPKNAAESGPSAVDRGPIPATRRRGNSLTRQTSKP